MLILSKTKQDWIEQMLAVSMKLLGIGALMMVWSGSAWAGGARVKEGEQCRDQASGYILASMHAKCSPSRYHRYQPKREQPIHERDALLHYQAGEHRPRIIRAVLHTGAR